MTIKSIDNWKLKAWKYRRGFTLIELSVVLVILVLAASFAIPSVIAMQKSRALKDLEGNIARVPSIARNDAVKDQVPVTVQLQGTYLTIQEIPQTGNTPTSSPQTGSSVTLQQVDLGSDLQITTAQLNGQTVDPGSWIWTAYPDGTSDIGGLEFSEGAETKSLTIWKDGSSEWSTGSLADPSSVKWTAGVLQQRAQ